MALGMYTVLLAGSSKIATGSHPDRDHRRRLPATGASLGVAGRAVEHRHGVVVGVRYVERVGPLVDRDPARISVRIAPDRERRPRPLAPRDVIGLAVALVDHRDGVAAIRVAVLVKAVRDIQRVRRRVDRREVRAVADRCGANQRRPGAERIAEAAQGDCAVSVSALHRWSVAGQTALARASRTRVAWIARTRYSAWACAGTAMVSAAATAIAIGAERRLFMIPVLSGCVGRVAGRPVDHRDRPVVDARDIDRARRRIDRGKAREGADRSGCGRLTTSRWVRRVGRSLC